MYRKCYFVEYFFSFKLHLIPTFLDLVKFVMCTMVSRVHMTFDILTKGYIVPGNQGTYDKLNQIQKCFKRRSNPELSIECGLCLFQGCHHVTDKH